MHNLDPKLVLAGIVFVVLLSLAVIAMWEPLTADGIRERIADVRKYKIHGGAELAKVAAPANRESSITKLALSFLDRQVRSRGMREKIMNDLDAAGVKMRPEEWALLRIGISAVSGAMLMLVLG